MPKKRIPGQRAARNSNLAGITASAAEVLAPPVAAKLGELLRPYLEDGESMPDAELLQKLVGRLLGDREKQLGARVESANETRAGAVAWRMRRDDAAKALREELRKARFYFDQTRGKGEGARQGLGEGLSYMAPAHLARVAVHVAAVLEEHEARYPRNETLPSPSALAETVRQKAAVLGVALKTLEPKRQEAGISRVKRTREHATIERTVRRTAGFLAGLYKLCDFDHLAKVVRPVFRRKKRRRPQREEELHRLPNVAVAPVEAQAEQSK